jgi:hypothetical protein
MSELNAGHQGTGFEFLLAATDTVFNETWYECSDASAQLQRQFKATLYKHGSNVLNVYLCNLCVAQPCKLGYSTFPEAAGKIMDGVVMMRPGLESATDNDLMVTFNVYT